MLYAMVPEGCHILPGRLTVEKKSRKEFWECDCGESRPVSDRICPCCGQVCEGYIRALHYLPVVLPDADCPE